MNKITLPAPYIILFYNDSPPLHQAMYRYNHDEQYTFNGYTVCTQQKDESLRFDLTDDLLLYAQAEDTKLMFIICADTKVDKLKEVVIRSETKIDEIWCIGIHSENNDVIVASDSVHQPNMLIRELSISEENVQGFVYQLLLLTSRSDTHIGFCTQSILDAISSRYLMCSKEYIVQSSSARKVEYLILKDRKFSKRISEAKWIFLRISACNLSLGEFQDINDSVMRLCNDSSALNTSHVQSSSMQNNLVHVEIIIFTCNC